MPQEFRGGLKVTDEQAAIVDPVAREKLTGVDAGARSGKAYTAVATVLHLLEDYPQAAVDRSVLSTFTRNAAHESKHGREAAPLDRQRRADTPDQRQQWAEARERLSSAYVGTIHGFCRRLLRAFGHGAMVAREAEVDLSGGGLL